MDNSHNFRYFDVLDYVVFGVLLAFSALIGVYFAFCAKRKQNTTAEYLLGSKTMGIFPVSMSLIASYTSHITLLGFPSEVYVYGTQLGMALFAEFVAFGVMAVVFIPVFYKLDITSTYEYLNRRFNSTTRTLGSILFLCKMMLYIPIVVYGPALAFSQVSGFSLEVLIPAVCIVCIFYTTLGGIKAVVWTDTLQIFLMMLGVITVTVMGTHSVGGFQNIYKINSEGGRLEFFNTSWDPTIRHTLWNVLIGRFFGQLSSCTINQAMVQRCLAMPSLRDAHKATLIFAIGTITICWLSYYCGLVIYAAFYACDPVSTGLITKADQLLPYFVMKITSHVPALPGIFVSGVFGAALSTMSTGLNSMCGVILEDFIRPLHKKPISEERASLYMKAITVFIGVLCILLAFVVDKLGGIIQVSGSLGGITGGTLLGIFTLGMLFPWANAYGAIIGGSSSFLLVGWICVGSQLAIHDKKLIFPTKPVSIEGCDNETLLHYWGTTGNQSLEAEKSVEAPFILYTVSYMYFTVIGLVTVLIVGMVVSYFTGLNDPSEMDPDVLSPVIHKFLGTRQHRKKRENIERPVPATMTIPLMKGSRK